MGTVSDSEPESDPKCVQTIASFGGVCVFIGGVVVAAAGEVAVAVAGAGAGVGAVNTADVVIAFLWPEVFETLAAGVAAETGTSR